MNVKLNNSQDIVDKAISASKINDATSPKNLLFSSNFIDQSSMGNNQSTAMPGAQLNTEVNATASLPLPSIVLDSTANSSSSGLPNNLSPSAASQRLATEDLTSSSNATATDLSTSAVVMTSSTVASWVQNSTAASNVKTGLTTTGEKLGTNSSTNLFLMPSTTMPEWRQANNVSNQIESNIASSSQQQQPSQNYSDVTKPVASSENSIKSSLSLLTTAIPPPMLVTSSKEEQLNNNYLFVSTYEITSTTESTILATTTPGMNLGTNTANLFLF